MSTVTDFKGWYTGPRDKRRMIKKASQQFADEIRQQSPIGIGTVAARNYQQEIADEFEAGRPKMARGFKLKGIKQTRNWVKRGYKNG